MSIPTQKHICWRPNTKEELKSWPVKVRLKFANSLKYLLAGRVPSSAKFMREYPGKSLIRVKHEHLGLSYRLVLTGKHPTDLYVLVAFIKKSPKGNESPHGVDAKIEEAYYAAEQHWKRE